MEVIKLNECGYEESAWGFSLSYNSTVERAKEILPKFAFKGDGENKFLRSIHTWWNIKAPRYYFAQHDTYKIATVKLSESTMHTITKRNFSQDDFQYPIEKEILDVLNDYINWYKYPPKGEETEYKEKYFLAIKNSLPEGYLQRIMFECNYATLQAMWNGRLKHKLPQWKQFLETMISQIEHPEFVMQDPNR